eukprot:1933637-Prymnesium_polylepis.2
MCCARTTHNAHNAQRTTQRERPERLFCGPPAPHAGRAQHATPSTAPAEGAACGEGGTRDPIRKGPDHSARLAPTPRQRGTAQSQTHGPISHVGEWSCELARGLQPYLRSRGSPTLISWVAHALSHSARERGRATRGGL